MPGRFYYRPIETGHDQFGAAIAAGMGAGIDNFQRGRATAEEQKRYEAEVARQKAADAIAAENLAIARRASGLTEVSVAPQQVTPTDFGPIGAAINVAPVTGVGMAAGAAGPAGIGLQEGAVPQTVAGALGVQAPEQSFDFAPAPVTLPQVVEPEDVPGSFQAGDKRFAFDPSQSFQGITNAMERGIAKEDEEAQYQKSQERIQEGMKLVRGVVADIMQDGVVTDNERLILKQHGLSENDLKSEEELDKKALNFLREQEKIKIGFDLQRIGAQAVATKRELTAGQARNAAIQSAMGRMLARQDEGVPFAEIHKEILTDPTMADAVKAIGGGDALYAAMSATARERDAITLNQARAAAAAAIEDSGEEVTEAEVSRRAQQIIAEGNEAARQRAAAMRTAGRPRTPPAYSPGGTPIGAAMGIPPVAMATPVASEPASVDLTPTEQAVVDSLIARGISATEIAARIEKLRETSGKR